MDTRKEMIVIQGVIKTCKVALCEYNREMYSWNVWYNDGRFSIYRYDEVEKLTNPKVLNPVEYRISRNGKEFFNIEEIYVFNGREEEYWHICFKKEIQGDYFRRDLSIDKSILSQGNEANKFEYMKQIAELSDLRNNRTGDKLLVKKYEKISFISPYVALSHYLNPANYKIKKGNYTPIFPFGCNNSQYTAVKKAMENQISVIQGPPGTGKTQTILNIIANILMDGKTVQIVSGNNSATENVYEKLSFPEYNMGFIAARLGNSENKKRFIEQQSIDYPDFSSWRVHTDILALQRKIHEDSVKLRTVFDKQERLAVLRQELSQMLIEQEYFNQYVQEKNIYIAKIKFRKKISSKKWIELWQEWQMAVEEKQKISLWIKLKSLFMYGIGDWKFYKQDITNVITIFQVMYYYARKEELTSEILEIETYLKNTDQNLLNNLCSESMLVLKNQIAKRYGNNTERRIFTEDDLWKNSEEVLAEYPVVLSTTFSARNSLNSKIIYDYLIMDEASQVDIATGVLALSCARNVVIVGDTKQLPNVVPNDIKNRADAIFNNFKIDEGYRYTKSFLQSVLEIIPNVTQTMLREHYRCHPKIINFCNQKFYHGELLIMTEDHGEEDVLSVVKTVVGNHARDHYSQRQIDVIKNEIIPQRNLDLQKTGIITPYRNQMEALCNEILDTDIATVHKFQGREKENIIISTVDDEISDFVDDPYLLNVAVSRAKKRLILVVTGNEQTRERNITDLVAYIQYNNFEVTDSKIYSIFDYLYKQYTEARKLYLKNHPKVSKYDSENLMYSLIEDILAENKYASLDVVCHFPLNKLIRSSELLSDEERRYVAQSGTHVDFLIYSRLGKKPILAIEVDGYEYHQAESKQAFRDSKKNHIFELYKIPLLRFCTNGSGEKQQIIEKLEEVMG